MIKPLSIKITSDHLLLCVFLCLLWGTAYSNTTSTPSATLTATVRNGTADSSTTSSTPSATLTATGTADSSTTSSTPSATLTATGTADYSTTSSTSATLTATGTADYSTTSSTSATLTATGTADYSTTSSTSATLTATGTADYSTTSSTSATLTAPVRKAMGTTEMTSTQSTTLMTPIPTTRSPPPNAENFQWTGQNETSITLQWKKVENILNYTLVFGEKDKNVTATAEDTVIDVVSGLTNAAKYNFTLYTVRDGVRSSGVSLTAVTAPPNAENFQRTTQNETSITLQWKKVENILNYTLVFGEKEKNVTATAEDTVIDVVSGLTSGTENNFTLYTVFGGVRSSGVKLTAVTAPPNAENFQRTTQNETSITLQWRKVRNILDYTLVFGEGEKNVTAKAEDTVIDIVSGLTSGTENNFTLYTVFGGVRSSGVSLTAVTAPSNAENFQRTTQNETSITLQWRKVRNILDYTLVFGEGEKNVTAKAEDTVIDIVSGLTSGTENNFTLYTVFGGVRSSGVKLTAVTAPSNAENFQPTGQNETSITLQWRKVRNILDYTLVFDEGEKNVTAKAEDTVIDIVSGLTSGKEYNFTLYTVFGGVRSSGVNLRAVTAPERVNMVRVTQNDSSITLRWDKVNSISTYVLLYDGNDGPVREDISALPEDITVTHVVSPLTAGKKYYFILTTVFGEVNSTKYTFEAVTVPPKVSSVDVTERSVTSLTLNWENADINWTYLLQINGSTVTFTQDIYPKVSYSVSPLKPGTQYNFSVITVFSGFNSTAYEACTVTTIDCASVPWHVTNSSIHGMVEGLFSNATATYEQTHISPQGSNVSFTGLVPGATYNLFLEYETCSQRFPQCHHTETVRPSSVSAHCDYLGAGYSISVVWIKPNGVWTQVEVNVSGQSHPVPANGEQSIQISGFQPARTYEVTVDTLSGHVRSSAPYVFLCDTDPRGVIAGSVFAVLLFALVCLAVFLVLKRPDLIRKKSFIGGAKLSNPKSKAISVAEFPNHFNQLSADDNRGFSQEYENLVPVGTEQTRKAAVLPENKAKNRFNNVLPYDWCRVRLNTSNPNGTSDYINASYMPGYNSNREYIATQGPLPSTVNDFWRMIWEQRVKGIVMVTNCIEGGRTKCEQYWPGDGKPCHYGELLITTRSEQQETNWTLREFSLKHTETSEKRKVKHFHFTAWPDHGVPQGTKILIQFRELVRWHIEREADGAPTVVHCSAGVGRTGTIIALDVLLQQLVKKRGVGINAFVHKMRLSRPYMVQTESQYVFLHQCIMDSLQPDEKMEENIYENADMIYVNATALRELQTNG
ncbi:receptor-type tyrosine-protein phosphatase H isoform X9 [Lates calcarifer]|uniref:protein-tyrosine-phosphatase n=1 Tax=Lates calcarifer TaxID=8187 RepID=A0AAJ8DKR6_LATCA|nr:receptor-type tyrosine-protein phosphatase H isoform X8 [Lates calcarifer]XP_050922376.1 receptor-type tyrosine-protein phosphatase H isoform X9 [Lates calcarifer]